MKGRILCTGAVVMSLGIATLAAAAVYEGTSGDDTVTVEQGSSLAHLKGGNDTFTGAGGEDGGSDHVFGGEGGDDLSGRTFSDILRGQDGADTVRGGRGRDGVYGGHGDDTLFGGRGTDRFKPKGGVDTCIGRPKDYGFPGRCEIVQITGS